MPGLAVRVGRLEQRNGLGRNCPDIAVVRSSLPPVATEDWARGILDQLQWDGRSVGVWVVPGEWETLLPITPVDGALSGHRERVWLQADQQYPFVLVLAGGFIIEAERVDTAEQYRSRCLEAAREA